MRQSQGNQGFVLLFLCELELVRRPQGDYFSSPASYGMAIA
ncbi:hypothetical protein [Aureliella helgolandensis]|nr:hypothetical protein [Aureliella helgolandensis]